MRHVFQYLPGLKSFGLVVLVACGLSACGGPQVASGVYDPFEAQNRAVHAENVKLDKGLLRPVAGVYGTVLPQGARDSIGRFADNVALPGIIVNDLLQLKIGNALHNSVRFVLNTTVGLGGFFDPASAGGLELRGNDFGQTLHVWGFKEGAYLELPVFGPSNTRDTVGRAVDVVLNPLNFILPKPEAYWAPASRVASTVGDRYQFGDTVDAVLYDSADSYAQTRLFYLESRRFGLGTQVETELDVDIYEDLYE